MPHAACASLAVAAARAVLLPPALVISDVRPPCRSQRYYATIPKNQRVEEVWGQAVEVKAGVLRRAGISESHLRQPHALCDGSGAVLY